ncbi:MULTISPECIES: hypothetical protein [unclassified Tolypothrix]|uniref:hypothetical protein n=1 Tax=unclassified Tolypothrix TaxID=2649714 RepID=UPI0005EAC7B1|nr:MULTISPECIES: hypothetical protein [unclassified Tolypothrix]BAY94955.1 hypothetical protein NIES3275_70100 [Microchaete diplosiphon NIES-3275]EKE97109.1 hypothetical protein FDUTEX481_06003 [Tolypothrix sp. PCC 7601]MBE9086720.1 hypothetical protein [Tolypothrix sp. LEGE 11397]UYD28592.1 hypothetical protein HGR01_11455 [Tolypothrix sp. PCC 7712]UYD35498.1 hypothetical protein HG267_06920 [Tolypothrix sp. PCC 7601]
MPKSLIYRASDEKEALRQGEILTGVIQFIPVPNEASPELDKTQFKPIIHPYAIVVSQDCDLDWDYKARQTTDKQNKLLNSILCCEIYQAQEIRQDRNTYQMNSEKWNLVKTNCNKQFHFFEKIPLECDLTKEGLAELTADFKKVFAVDPEFLYYQISINKVQRRSVFVSPYLEDFFQRYYSYHGRVALPAQHESEKGG